MRIIVTGLVGQYAFGGVAWDYLQYVEGFRQLGHEVFYLEDTEMWPYDPVNNTISADCSYNVRYLHDIMSRFGLTGHWIHRNAADASYHGVSEAEAKAFCASADVFRPRLSVRYRILPVLSKPAVLVVSVSSKGIFSNSFQPSAPSGSNNWLPPSGVILEAKRTR